MRTVTNINNTSAVEVPTVITDGIQGTTTLELRATLKKAAGTNQRVFVFHGGHVTARKDGSSCFGSFRPTPWMKKNGEFVIEDGSHKKSTVWARNVWKETPDLDMDTAAIVGALQTNPQLVAVFPQYAHLLKGGLKYGDNNPLPDYLLSLFGTKEGYLPNIQFTFSIPSKFAEMVEEIRELLADKEPGENYSFVVRFDATKLNVASEIEEEYTEDAGWIKKVPIYPTYIGWIEGTSNEDSAKFIDPEQAATAFQQSCNTASTKPKYKSVEDLKNESAAIAEKLKGVKKGKKGHESVLQQLFNAVDKVQNNRKGSTAWKEGVREIQEAKELLQAIEDRGENSRVQPGYTEQVVNKALKEIAGQLDD